MSEIFRQQRRFRVIQYYNGPWDAADLRMLLGAIASALPDFKVLIKPFADPELTEDQEALGMAYLEAAKRGLDSVLLLLLKSGVHVDFVDADGKSALYWAAEGGHAKVVSTLLEHRADVKVTSTNGETALLIAAGFYDYDLKKSDNERRAVAMVRLLLDAGALVNVANFFGITPLMRSASNGYVSVVRVLLRQGADKRARDNLGLEAGAHAHGKMVKKLLA